MAKKDFDNSKFWIEHGIDLDNRQIMLSEDVDEVAIGFIIRGILKMVEYDSNTPIDVYVSTFGGCAYSELALYDVLRSLPCEVHTYALGKVMSAGIALFLAGDKRYCFPTVRFMAHSAISFTSGKAFTMTVDTKECEYLYKVSIEMYADRSKKTKSWWHKEIQFKDKYFGAKDALKWGVATEILETND